MISSTLLTLIVIPAIFGLIKGIGLPSERHLSVQDVPDASEAAE
jgi:Cu(I)/Ag(I) efflux system membrane protein CusA/SilA